MENRDLPAMEVLVGPTFIMDAAAVASPCGLFFAAKDDEEKENSLSSISSSSIGASDDDSDEEVEDDAVSSMGIGSLDSLEDSLPIKRGLSNYFSGKSKSFADLSEVTSPATVSVKEIEKFENPFNKRRRILVANRWTSASRKSSFYAWQNNNPTSMPLLTLHEDDREALHDDGNHRLASSSSTDDPEQDQWGPPPRFNHRLASSSSSLPLLSRSCFSLSQSCNNN